MSSWSALNSLLGSGSSGIDIASLLQTAFGASSSGIDVTSAVNSAVAAARAPEDTWRAQQTNLQGQASALNQLDIEVTRLQDDLTTLNNAIDPLAARTVTSSDSRVVSGSASANSSVGAHMIVVNSLATTASWASATVANASTVLGAGSFAITTADGTTTSFSTANSTMADLASQINAAGLV
jgi:flagellar hook-associated protein 2